MALLVSILLFGYWSLIGWAATLVLGSGRNLRRNALLAPILGAALTVLPLVWSSRAGAPVRYSGPVIALLSVALACFAVFRFRRPYPVRRVVPFAVILLIALLLTGYPLILYGFNWAAYCNDDMANYALAAQQFHQHGFFQLPDQRMLVENRDSSLNLWFLYALAGVRPGSELVLAWVMSLTGLSAHQCYMPTILVFHMILIATTAALVLQSRRETLASIVACSMLGLSALNSLATVYQLMPQVFGLSLVAALGCLLLRPLTVFHGKNGRRQAILTGILGAACGVVYPEVTPFVILPAALYHSIALIRRWQPIQSLPRALAIIGGFTVILLNTFIPSTLSFLREQAGRSLVSVDLSHSLFPYYLVPSGFANLWGFVPIDVPAPPHALDAWIVIGALLFAACAVAAFWQAWQGRPAASICVVMLILGIELFRKRNDFGLFKLAMYLQPFLLSSTVLAWFRFVRRAK
jgi:hypothetical protein